MFANIVGNLYANIRGRSYPGPDTRKFSPHPNHWPDHDESF